MNTKITLNIEKDLIDKANIYAQSQGINITNLIENYLKSLVFGNFESHEMLKSKVKTMRGSFNSPIGFDYKEELNKALTEKYL